MDPVNSKSLVNWVPMVLGRHNANDQEDHLRCNYTSISNGTSAHLLLLIPQDIRTISDHYDILQYAKVRMKSSKISRYTVLQRLHHSTWDEF